MEIKGIGYNHEHDKYFAINRPHGTKGCLFLLIKSPAIFMIDGKKEKIRENSFILYVNNYPQYYTAANQNYIDDWVHFEIDKEDMELFKSLQIPLNAVTLLPDISELSALMRIITYEFYSASLYITDITEFYFKILLFKLSILLHSRLKSPTVSSFINYDKMINLRTRIYNNPKEFQNVDQIASELSFSKSWFQHNYKKIFGVSVISDIINSRLSYAKRLLNTTDMPLKKIAEYCGYNNEHHFIRQFKQKHGITPSKYRNVL